MCVSSDWGRETARKPKISYLDRVGITLHKDVLGLQVSVQHPVGMDERHTLQHLIHVGLQHMLNLA